MNSSLFFCFEEIPYKNCQRSPTDSKPLLAYNLAVGSKQFAR